MCGYVPSKKARSSAQLIRQIVVGRVERAAQRVGGDPIRAGRPSDPEVDAAGVQRLQHPELLRDHERLVVRQHHTARAEPQGRRRAREMGDQNGGGRARDAGHVVVLGDPVAPIPEPLDMPGEVDRAAQRVADRRAGRHRREIEDRQRRPADRWRFAHE